MPNWAFFLADHAGVPLAELATASGRNITYLRNDTPEAQLTISHEDEAAGLLLSELKLNGTPILKGYRDSVLRFAGYLAPFSEELEEAAQMHLVFRGPFGRLAGEGTSRGRFTVASVTYTATDAGTIAKALIDSTAACGIATTGTIEPTVARDRTYAYANIGEAIMALTKVQGGFDFEVLPLDSGSTIGQFFVYASQGGPKADAVFEYGPDTIANVKAVQRQIQPPVNVARVLGANGLVSLQTSAASIANYGECWVQGSATDVSEQATLDAKALGLLRPNPIRIISFSPDPALAPRPWDDYWLGDTVSFHARRGAFEESVTMRVNKITVAIDEEGNETYSVEDPSADADVTASLQGEVL